MTGTLPIFERDAYTLATKSQFYTLLLEREVEIEDRALSVEIRKAYTTHCKTLDGKLVS